MRRLRRTSTAAPSKQAANIHIGISTPNFLIQETIERMDGFHAEIVTDPIQWEDGYIFPSDKPGLGVELNEEVAEKHPCNDQLWD